MPLGPLVDEVVEWIGRNLEAGYPWPGNFRELEQCVRNLMIRNHYQPPGVGEPRTKMSVRPAKH